MFKYCCLLLLLVCSAKVGFARKQFIPGGQIIYFEDQFKKTIECGKKQLAAGVPDCGIPPLDPWQSDQPIDLNLDNKYIRTKIELNNTTADGLLSLETTSLTLTPLMQLDIKFYFKKFRASTLYEGEFNVLSFLGFYGDGIIDVEFEDIVVDTFTQFRMVPPLVGDYRITITVGNATIKITGIDGDEDLSKQFSSIISQAAPVLINRFKNEISDIISPLMKKSINLHIGDLSFLDFLAVVTTYSCD